MLCHWQVPVKCRPTEARCSTCGRRPLLAAARGFCSWDTLFWSHGRSPSPLPCRPPGDPAWPLGQVVIGLVWSRAPGAGWAFGDCLGEERDGEMGSALGQRRGSTACRSPAPLAFPHSRVRPSSALPPSSPAASGVAALPCSLPRRCP